MYVTPYDVVKHHLELMMETLDANSLLCGLLDVDLSHPACLNPPRTTLIDEYSSSTSKAKVDQYASKNEKTNLDIDGVYCKASRHTNWLQRNKPGIRKWVDRSRGHTSCLCDFCIFENSEDSEEEESEGNYICQRSINKG